MVSEPRKTFALVGRLKPRQMRAISAAFRLLIGECRVMGKSIVVAAFLLAATVGVCGLRARQSSCRAGAEQACAGPSSGSGLSGAGRRDRAAARRSSSVGADGARSQDPAGEQPASTTASARGADPDPPPQGGGDAQRAAAYSTVTCVFTEFAMKQISWASWCRRSSASFCGAAPAHSIFGRSFTLVTASRPGAMSSVVPSA